MRPLLQRAAAAVEPPFSIGALVVLVFAVWAAKDAGYAPATWYPGALFILLLAAVGVLAYGRVAAAGHVLVAVGFLTAYAAWSALSITWSSDQGAAWDGANRTILYAIVFALFAVVPWPRGALPIFLCGFSLAVLGIGVVDLIRAAEGDPGRFFIHGRFAAPAGYANAACALYLMSFFPLAYAAARREPSPAIRALLLAAATALVELAVLAESRGSLFAVPIAVIVYLVLVPRRTRAALALLVVGAAAFLARRPLLDVYDPVRRDEGAGAAIEQALQAIAISVAAIFVLWLVVAALDARLTFSRRAVRLANIAALALAVVALAIGATAFALATPGPGDRIGDAWRHFKAGYSGTSSSSHFSSGLGNNRYDFWRVALLEFREHPLRGVGADNFADDYVLLRRSDEEPLYPHSLELRVLAQTGIVGAVLLVGFLAAVGVGLARRARRSEDFTGGLVCAGLAGVAYWAIHGSADWFWEFAGLTSLAMAWLGLAANAAQPAAALRHVRRGAGAGILALTLLAAGSFAFPWLAELNARRAAATWAGDPASAFASLEDARNLNPLSTRADVLAGAIASRKDDLPRMGKAFRRAIARDPRSWYAHFELGLAEAGLGNREEALRELQLAGRLNPREPIIDQVRRLVVDGRRIERERIDRLFVERVEARVGP